MAVADFDNDGLLDLHVTGYGGNALYHNLGDCKFEDITEKAGVRGGGFNTGAAWGDYDRDGYVDLFVSRYGHVDIHNLPEFGRDKFCRYKGVLVQLGPQRARFSWRLLLRPVARLRPDLAFTKKRPSLTNSPA